MSKQSDLMVVGDDSQLAWQDKALSKRTWSESTDSFSILDLNF